MQQVQIHANTRTTTRPDTEYERALNTQADKDLARARRVRDRAASKRTR